MCAIRFGLGQWCEMASEGVLDLNSWSCRCKCWCKAAMHLNRAVEVSTQNPRSHHWCRLFPAVPFCFPGFYPETINPTSIWAAARDASQWDRGANPQIWDHTLRFFQLPRVSIDHRAFLSDAMDAGWQSVQFSDIVGRQDRPLFQGHLLKLSHWFLVQAARYL